MQQLSHLRDLLTKDKTGLAPDMKEIPAGFKINYGIFGQVQIIMTSILFYTCSAAQAISARLSGL